MIGLQKRTGSQVRTFTDSGAPAAAGRSLTDEQLLAMFPNTPVGLAKVNGRKVLIFPRAADQARYVGKF